MPDHRLPPERTSTPKGKEDEMMNEQKDDDVHGYFTDSDLIHSDLSLLERTLMGAIRSLCGGYIKAKPGSYKYGGVWYELDTECAKRINVPVVSVRKARRSLQGKGWLKGSKLWHGRCNVKMSPKWYAKREIAEGSNMDWTGKGGQIDHSDTTDHWSHTGDHYNQSIKRLVEDKRTESVALGAPSSFEQADSKSSTTSSDLVAEAHARADADFQARQQAAVDIIKLRHAEAQAKLNMPTSFPLEPAPLPEALPCDSSTAPLEQSTPVCPVPPKPTESCTAILERIKAKHRPTTVPTTANVEVATAVNAPSFITRLRTGMINQCGSGNDSAQLEAKLETVTGPEYRPSSVGFCMESAMDRIKASDAAHIN